MILSPRTLVVEIKDALKLWNNDLNHRRTESVNVAALVKKEGNRPGNCVERRLPPIFLAIFCFHFSSVQFSSVQSLSRVRLFATP